MAFRPLGLLDEETRQRKLEALGDPLVVLNRIVPWEMFREPLEALRGPRDPRRGGRPPHDAVRMFKILVLREWYALSDEQVEYQIADRLSFQRFLGINLTQDAPDYTAVWRFREQLGKEDRMKALFEQLGTYIDLAGFQAKHGQMLDASLVAKPITRQPAEPKPGEAALRRQQAAHRDADANWTKKHGKSYFGYKNHINADVAHGFIRDYAITPAAVHDSQCIEALLDTSGQPGQSLYGDSAYRSAETAARCRHHGLKDRTMYKANRHRPLTAQQQGWNKARAKIRARVEHVFARIKGFRHAKPLRCTGLMRAKVCLGLVNFVHNLRHLLTKHRIAMGTA